jgi:hypothetical protein
MMTLRWVGVARELAPGAEISFGIILGLIGFCFAVLAILLGRPFVEAYRRWRSMPRAR